MDTKKIASTNKVVASKKTEVKEGGVAKLVAPKKITAPKQLDTSTKKVDMPALKTSEATMEIIKPRRIQTAEGWKRGQLKKKK